jgi:hypothetical protein
VHRRPNTPQPIRVPSSRHARMTRTGNLAAVGDQDSLKGSHYILNTPNFAVWIGALNAAEMPSARASRVRAGSRIPSSQMRAVE